MIKRRKTVAVIGGGPAGLAAALALDAGGVDTVLFEKEEYLGGKAASFTCKASDRCLLCGACMVREKIDAVSSSSVDVWTGQEITSVTQSDEGYIISIPGHDMTAHGIVIASGYDNFNPSIEVEYGYGVNPDIVTGYDCELMLREKGKLLKPSDSTLPGSVAFIQCVGSRDTVRSGNYCSEVCCRYSLRIASMLKERNPETEITFYAIDLQRSGKDFRTLYSEVASHVQIVHGRPVYVRNSQSPQFRFKNEQTGEMETASYDMAVLSTGIRPLSQNRHLADEFVLDTDSNGFLCDGNAVRAAGTAKKPMSIPESFTSGEDAALSLIQELGA